MRTILCCKVCTWVSKVSAPPQNIYICIYILIHCALYVQTFGEHSSHLSHGQCQRFRRSQNIFGRISACLCFHFTIAQLNMCISFALSTVRWSCSRMFTCCCCCCCSPIAINDVATKPTKATQTSIYRLLDFDVYIGFEIYFVRATRRPMMMDAHILCT